MEPKPAIAPRVLAETPEFWVIDKPPGWLSVPGRHPTAPVLIDWVRQQLGEAWVCHRLDLETSGVFLVARNPEAHRKANQWFEGHRVKKQYLFIADGVDGTPALPVLRLDSPIEGARAVTQVEVRERFDGAFFGLARPQSGRRHQIRIHLSRAGHPIWGDRAYGSQRQIERTALHAWRLDLPTGEGFESPLPSDFLEWLETARGGSQ